MTLNLQAMNSPKGARNVWDGTVPSANSLATRIVEPHAWAVCAMNVIIIAGIHVLIPILAQASMKVSILHEHRHTQNVELYYARQ